MKNIQNNEEKYQKIVENILRKSSTIMNVLKVLESYAKKNPDFKNYYLAAGCINQTILNDFHGYPLDYGIEDYDIVYYDDFMCSSSVIISSQVTPILFCD